MEFAPAEICAALSQPGTAGFANADAQLSRHWRKSDASGDDVDDDILRERAQAIGTAAAANSSQLLAQLLDRKSLADAVIEGLCVAVPIVVPQRLAWSLVRIALMGSLRSASAAVEALRRSASSWLHVLAVHRRACLPTDDWRGEPTIPSMDAAEAAVRRPALRTHTELATDELQVESAACALLLASEGDVAGLAANLWPDEFAGAVFDWLDRPFSFADDPNGKIYTWWRSIVFPRVVVWRHAGPGADMRARASRSVLIDHTFYERAWQSANPELRQYLIVAAIDNAAAGESLERLSFAMGLTVPDDASWLESRAQRLASLARKLSGAQKAEFLFACRVVPSLRDVVDGGLRDLTEATDESCAVPGRYLGLLGARDLDLVKSRVDAAAAYLSAAPADLAASAVEATFERCCRQEVPLAPTVLLLLRAMEPAVAHLGNRDQWWPPIRKWLLHGIRRATADSRATWAQELPTWFSDLVLADAPRPIPAGTAWWWSQFAASRLRHAASVWGTSGLASQLAELAGSSLMDDAAIGVDILTEFSQLGGDLAYDIDAPALQRMRPSLAAICGERDESDESLVARYCREIGGTASQALQHAAEATVSLAGLTDALQVASDRVDAVLAELEESGNGDVSAAQHFISATLAKCEIAQSAAAAEGDWLDEPAAAADPRFVPVLRVLAEFARRSENQAVAAVERTAYRAAAADLSRRIGTARLGIHAWEMAGAELLRNQTVAANLLWDGTLAAAPVDDRRRLTERAWREKWAPVGGDTRWAAERWIDGWLSAPTGWSMADIGEYERGEVLQRLQTRLVGAVKAHLLRRERADRAMAKARTKVAEAIGLTLDSAEQCLRHWLQMREALTALGIERAVAPAGSRIIAPAMCDNAPADVVWVNSEGAPVAATAGRQGMIIASGFACTAIGSATNRTIVRPATAVADAD